MKVRNFIKNGLIYFVIASLGFLAGKSFRADGVGVKGDLHGDGIYVTYYFYGKKRCDACRTLERETQLAIEDGFAAKGVKYEFVDCDRPDNLHYMKELGLGSKSVVISSFTQGMRADHEVLDMGQAFSLIDRPTEYRAMLGARIKAMLAKAGHK